MQIKADINRKIKDEQISLNLGNKRQISPPPELVLKDVNGCKKTGLTSEDMKTKSRDKAALFQMWLPASGFYMFGVVRQQDQILKC